MTERKAREEMLKAGAVAIFDKPIPLADFLDAVERSLGLVRTIFPPESSKETEAHRQTLSELLGGFRQKIKADAVFLISDRGRVLARAGDLYDSSMEVSLLSALMAIYSAGLKVSRFIHQENLDNYHVFRGGDHDLILIPVNAAHMPCCWLARILPAQSAFCKRWRECSSCAAMWRMCCSRLGWHPSSGPVTESTVPEPEAAGMCEPQEPEPEVDLDALFAIRRQKISQVKDLDAFWDDAVEKTSNIPDQSGCDLV